MKEALSSLAILFLVLTGLPALAGEAPDEATLYRDEFGIPHIYDASLKNAAFAVGLRSG